jgi:hypothetical protein
MRRNGFRAWVCRLAGLLRTLGWAAALYLVASPWRELGGLIAERVRWFGWFVLYSGVVLGFALGDYIREALPPETGRDHLRLMRRMLYLPAALTAIWLVVLQSLGQRDVAGVVFTAFLSYWAGIDVALGAMSWMEGGGSGSTPEQSAASRHLGAMPPWES